MFFISALNPSCTQALERIRIDEEELAARIAYETKEELKREEQEMMEAKRSLKTFLLSNEVSDGVTLLFLLEA